MSSVEIFKKNGNNIIIEFDKITKYDISFLNNFFINKKRTYVNIIDQILDNNNLMMTFDENDEVLLDYLYLKYRIDDNKFKSKEEFVEKLYKCLFKDKFKQAIKDYVENNYKFEFDKEQEQNKKKYSESLVFTDQHVKILYRISMSVKFVIPLVLHYFSMNQLVIGDLSEYLIFAFNPLFTMMSEPNVNITNKLFESVRSRVNATRYSDRVHWYYTEIMGINVDSTIDSIAKKLIIDILPKYDLEQSVLSLNHACINNNIEYGFRINFPINYHSMSIIDKNEDDLSDFDKFQINNTYINESKLTLNKMNITYMLKDLMKKYNVKIKQEELNWYKDNVKVTKFQTNMLFMIMGKWFGNPSNLYSLNKSEYYVMMIICKKMLEEENLPIISKIISAKVPTNVTSKKVINTSIVDKIISSEYYNEIINTKYHDTVYNILNSNGIIKYISTIMNNNFLNNEYGDDDHSVIDYSDEEILNEMLCFVNLI